MRFARILFQPVILLRDYSRWRKTESDFTVFVNKWNSKQQIPHELNGNIAIVIQPWLRTTTPWFLIAIALFFIQSGKKITIIFDDFEFGTSKLAFHYQIKSIRNILSILPRSIEIIELSKIAITERDVGIPEKTIIDNLASMNTIHFMKGEFNAEGRKKYFDSIHKQLEKSYYPIKKLLNEKHFGVLVVAGGIWGLSGLYLKLAGLHKIRVSTFDSGFGTVFLNTIGIAAHQSDIPIAFFQLEEKFSDRILGIANEEMEQRKLGIEKHCSKLPPNQKIPYRDNNSENTVGVLILPNIVWDAPAIGLHTVFETMSDWIISSIQWILENSDEIITIRQHPHERVGIARSTDDYQILIRQRFSNTDRVRFISAHDEVNTYNLIEKSRFVISFSTTASMEAVAMGKVVVNVSSCYYSNLGFVYNAKTKEEYFVYLKDALSGNLKVSKKQKEDALKCYYLGQRCNPINSLFTPIGEDFATWVKKDPDEIFQLEEVQDYLNAIENGIPISFIRHHRMMDSNH